MPLMLRMIVCKVYRLFVTSLLLLKSCMQFKATDMEIMGRGRSYTVCSLNAVPVPESNHITPIVETYCRLSQKS